MEQTEEEIIKKINNFGYYEIKNLNKIEKKFDVLKKNKEKFTVNYVNKIQLYLLLKLLDKQKIIKVRNEVKYSGNGQILSTLTFDFFYFNTFDRWSDICTMVALHEKETKNPYQAVIRLEKIGKKEFIITNIDRNRKLWK